MVFRDFFGFGPKWYLSLVWGGANRVVAYNHPFCNDVEKKGLKAALSMLSLYSLFTRIPVTDAFEFF